MTKENRFEQLLMDDVKYWKVDEYEVNGYDNDNELLSYLDLDCYQDGKKLIFYINFTDIWSVLQTEYSLENQQIKEFTSSRLEQAYNFMDITTSMGF